MIVEENPGWYMNVCVCVCVCVCVYVCVGHNITKVN